MINSQELKDFILKNPKLVTCKESKTYPGLFVVKYTKSVFFKALWNENKLLEECRGLVVDKDFNPVIRPFQKVFNYQENGTFIDPSDEVEYCKKINGFMAALTLVDGKPVVSTTGSLDSDFVEYAKKYLDELEGDTLEEGLTYLFEICHTEDPHIIPEDEGAYLLGWRDVKSGETTWSFSELYENSVAASKMMGNYESRIEMEKDLGYQTLDRYTATFGKVLKEVKECKHEGFMVRSLKTGVVLKLKSPHYLVSKFLARVGSEKLIEGVKNGSIKARIDEEYYDLADNIKDNIDTFSALSEEDRLVYIRKFLS